MQQQFQPWEQILLESHGFFFFLLASKALAIWISNTKGTKMVSDSVLCHYKQQSPQAHKFIGWEGYTNNQNYNSSSAFRLYFVFHNYHSYSPNVCAYRDCPGGRALYNTVPEMRGREEDHEG